MLTPCPHCGKPMPPKMAWPGEEFPRTHGWPTLAKVSVFTRVRQAPHAPVREVAVVQVLDFYPEGKC